MSACHCSTINGVRSDNCYWCPIHSKACDMTKRELFAGLAMHALLISAAINGPKVNADDVVENAKRMADLQLAVLAKP